MFRDQLLPAKVHDSFHNLRVINFFGRKYSNHSTLSDWHPLCIHWIYKFIYNTLPLGLYVMHFKYCMIVYLKQAITYIPSHIYVYRHMYYMFAIPFTGEERACVVCAIKCSHTL